ncbi:hypothetical protein NQZ68_019078 [Dissostichus eleginoides]|nr:hypothetical protein NQZ68_019078 [Dissostichus eleginoides]
MQSNCLNSSRGVVLSDSLQVCARSSPSPLLFIVEVQGAEAGVVYIIHPQLLHSRSTAAPHKLLKEREINNAAHPRHYKFIKWAESNPSHTQCHPSWAVPQGPVGVLKPAKNLCWQEKKTEG